jgi:hypothetical protein
MAYRRRRGWIGAWSAVALGAIYAVPIMLPIAPVNSTLWNITAKIHDNFAEQIGWPEFLKAIATIHHRLPAEERDRAGIFVANYGEAGALNLYGPAYGLPAPISLINSYWYLGYPDPPPEPLIVAGLRPETVHRRFRECRPAGRVTNPYNVLNEETRDHPEIFVCRGLREPWAEFWKKSQRFG